MEQKEIQQEQQRWLKVAATEEFGHRQDVGPDEDLLWHEGHYQVEDLLGGLEDQGWCRACRVYGHTVAICPFQDEEEEPAQERKAGRRSRKRRGRGKLQQQQQPQQQQKEIGEDGWEVYITNVVAELCPSCGAYGHTLAVCPMQYEEGEREHPAPRRGERESVQRPDGGSPCVQCPEGGNLGGHSQRGEGPQVQNLGLQQQRVNACWFRLSRRGRTACPSHFHQQRVNTCLFHLSRRGRTACPSHLHQQRVNTCWFHIHRHGKDCSCPASHRPRKPCRLRSLKGRKPCRLHSLKGRKPCRLHSLKGRKPCRLHSPPPPWKGLLLLCLTPPKDACLAPPKDACLAPPKDACLAPPKDACCSTSPVESSVTEYEGEVELPLPPPWPGAPLLSSPPEGPLLLPSPPEGPLLLPSPPKGPLLLPSPPEGPASPGVVEGSASPGVATSPSMRQEIMWLEPHEGELPATKKGGRSGDQLPPQQIRCRRTGGRSPMEGS
ncbi:UNVERIFIED_CONTAM: hypothetical protein FKN15_051745 [Acipenser sinensis]